MTLRQLRKNKGLTQQQASALLGVSRKTYNNYERNEEGLSAFKKEAIYRSIERYGLIDENHGTLSVEGIKLACAPIMKEYNVEYAYLFGSYAKGSATEKSDVDILISVNIDGIKFFELVETIREALNKRVDILDVSQLNNNQKLTAEILRDGIKIYG